jgi:hypothetical protein
MEAKIKNKYVRRGITKLTNSYIILLLFSLVDYTNLWLTTFTRRYNADDQQLLYSAVILSYYRWFLPPTASHYVFLGVAGWRWIVLGYSRWMKLVEFLDRRGLIFDTEPAVADGQPGKESYCMRQWNGGTYD